MSETAACETPMSDHVVRFWQHLETEHVRILIDIRRDHEPDSGVMYHWDGASFPNDVAKALVAERKALVTALEEIAKGQGAFSRDPLTHASNTIDDMKALARRPAKPWSSRDYWMASQTGGNSWSRSPNLRIWDEAADAEISAAIAKANRHKKFQKLKRDIEAVPFNDLVTDETLDQFQIAVLAIKPIPTPEQTK